MPSVWAVSWGSAWSDSWGSVVPPEPPIRQLSLTARVENVLFLVGSSTVSSLPQSLSCVYGEAVTITVTMDSPPVGGVASWVMGFWLKKAQGQLPPAPVVTKVSGAGIAVLDPVVGSWTVTLDSPDTKQTPGTYFLDFWRTDDPTALAQGKFSIGDTTRP